MAEYIDREALREILDGWRDAHADVDDVHGCGLLEDVICEVDAQTAVDVAPVVRCMDCVRCRELNRKDRLEGGYAEGVLWCMNYSDGVWPDDFCSYGEPKEG